MLFKVTLKKQRKLIQNRQTRKCFSEEVYAASEALAEREHRPMRRLFAGLAHKSSNLHLQLQTVTLNHRQTTISTHSKTRSRRPYFLALKERICYNV